MRPAPRTDHLRHERSPARARARPAPRPRDGSHQGWRHRQDGRRRRICRGLRATSVGVVGLTMALAVVAPASAHPFGPPLTARIAATGDTVVVHWTGAEDDWVALARHVGVFDEPVPDPTDDSARMPGVSGLQRLQGSQRMRDYLLDHVVVTQAGDPCAGTVTDVGQLLGAGVELTFSCPAEVETIDLELTVLSDVHEAYRTVATPVDGATPARALYTRADPVHTWDLTRVAASGLGLQAVVVGVLVTLLVGAVLLWPSSRRRAAPGQRDEPDHLDRRPVAAGTSEDL